MELNRASEDENDRGGTPLNAASAAGNGLPSPWNMPVEAMTT
jgi:hypothetical protein